MAEITIEGLQTQIKGLEAQLANETKKSADIYAALEKSKADAEKSEKDLQEVIQGLQAKIAEQEKLLPPRVEVKVGKITYIVTGSVRLADGDKLPQDIAKDEALCKQLIEMGSPILKAKE